MITANIICDSINPAEQRITTFVLTYPRFIHAEFLTHRMISRNAASSRAIPVDKMIAAIRAQIAEPEEWGSNQSGMQAGIPLQGDQRLHARLVWAKAAEAACCYAEALLDRGLHKQIANRVVEPFAHITVVATATNWTNFFALRAHPLAQPEFQVLAYRMLDAYLKSKPVSRTWGEWHLPFIREEDAPEVAKAFDYGIQASLHCLAKISAARCARVSYLTHEGVRSVQKDLELYDRLVRAKPMHASALEHPARATGPAAGYHGGLQITSNFNPTWEQLRKMVPHECTHSLDLEATLAAKPEWITL